ncbi:hypothetical protein ACGFYP_34510 [Streptomyces sp. NPDC048370]
MRTHSHEVVVEELLDHEHLAGEVEEFLVDLVHEYLAAPYGS